MSLPTRCYDSNFNTSPFPILSLSLSPRSSSIYLCLFPLTTSFFSSFPFFLHPSPVSFESITYSFIFCSLSLFFSFLTFSPYFSFLSSQFSLPRPPFASYPSHSWSSLPCPPQPTSSSPHSLLPPLPTAYSLLSSYHSPHTITIHHSAAHISLMYFLIIFRLMSIVSPSRSIDVKIWQKLNKKLHNLIIFTFYLKEVW